MYKKIFFDANILVDVADPSRGYHAMSSASMQFCMDSNIEILTSCDIVTTLYYIYAKINRKNALDTIIKLNKFCRVIEFSNKEIDQTCQLMQKDSDYHDLEDTMQYILAQKEGCDLILTNDRKFVSKEVETMTAEIFCKKMGL